MNDETDAGYLEYVTGRIPALRRVAYLLSGDEHQADDLVQETITKLYATWPRVAKVDNVDAYVHTMLVRTFLDDRRRGWWRVSLRGGAPPEQPAAPNTPVEEKAVLRAALGRIPARQQAVLVLRFLCDRPVADVAELLGCSEGTVKSQTSHGLSALRRILGDRVGGAL
ncbi:SigE family RNA polymerase sigma factor [Actinoplanes sp. URMC 104]|uniref:SigE family RNA polymerase sigma factor n=1 Tax=Actinoplanes sp. URMC 104 TaxID=3423409 RepID=UPI003F1CAD50